MLVKKKDSPGHITWEAQHNFMLTTLTHLVQ